MAIISKGQITITKVNDGTGVVSIVDEYYLSTSSTQLLGGSWVSVAPGLTKGYYLWSRTTITYSDGVVDVTDPIMISGEHGADGYTIVLTNESHSVVCDATETPITGEIGSSGRAKSDIIVYKDTTKLVAVANTATPTVGQFNYTIGTVTNGTAGRTDNDTFYLNTITSKSASIPITINVENTKSFTKSMTVTKSIAGQNGTNASYVSIAPSNLFFKCSANSTSYSPSTITLTPTFINSLYTNWQYSIDGGATWITVTSGANGLTITGNVLSVENSSSLFTSSVATVTFKVNGSNSVTDVVTLAKLKDGDDGSNGLTILLDNENHCFIATSNGNAVATSITVNILCLVGATQTACTIGTITGAPTGMTVTPSGSGTTAPKLTIAVTTSMNTKNGTLTIPISCNGITFNKMFTFSLTIPGSSAMSADIVSSSQMFKSADGGITFSPNAITLTPILQNVTFSKWQYSIDGTTWTDIVSGSNGFTIASNVLTIDKSCTIFTTVVTTVSFKLITSNSSIYDTCTIVKLYDVSEITVGARNLTRNGTWNLGIDTNWTTNSNMTLLEPESDKDTSNVLTYSKTGLTSSTYAQKWSKEVDVLTTLSCNYTLSFDFKTDSKAAIDSNRIIAVVRMFDTTGKTAQSDSVEYFNITIAMFDSKIIDGKWVRLSYTFAPTKGQYIRVGPYMAQNGTAYWREFKLELGNKNTEYTPAIEDVLDELYKNIDDVKRETKETFSAEIKVMKDRITSEVADTYTTQDSFSTTTSALSSQINQTASDITNTFTSKTDTMIGDLQAYKEEVSTNIRFSATGIDIGKTNSDFKMQLSNTALQFKQNNTVVAEITNQRMAVTDGDFKNSMSIGKFEWRPDDAGNLVMVWTN